MIKPIVKDVLFLGQKSGPAVKADLSLAKDLQDTLAANRERCVGMAANMIGVKKRAIIVSMGLISVVMFNPVITKKDGPYEAEEGCLSLTGVRKTTRYEAITLEYIDVEWKRQRRTFTGWTARSSSTKSTTWKESLFKQPWNIFYCSP